MKTIQNRFDEYAESHRTPVNKMIHWICVPLIYFSIVCFLVQAKISTGWPVLTIVFSLACIYYFVLSNTIAIGMLLVTMACALGARLIHRYAPYPLWEIALIIFVLAWIGQFIGHKIEGKKPSFFKDLLFLLIGPAWLLSFIYARVGIKV